VARIGPNWLFVTLAFILATWLALSTLLIATRGNLEALLATTIGRLVRPDAFKFVNGVSVLLWCVHSCLAVIAIAASRWHRGDVVALLLIGPVIALAIALLGQRWDDPNWHDFLAVCTIGWFVSTVVASCYWLLKGRIYAGRWGSRI
jgi:hypothetical protein